jgi:hypothetical protein
MTNLKAFTAVLFLTAALSGCHVNAVRNQTFLNKTDSSQVLTLEAKPSFYTRIIGRLHGVQMTGVYTLKTEKGTKSGQYTYVFDDATHEGQYIFHPEQGKRWEAKINPRGSFTDADGTVWMPQAVQVEARMLKKIGG